MHVACMQNVNMTVRSVHPVTVRVMVRVLDVAVRVLGVSRAKFKVYIVSTLMLRVVHYNGT